MENEEALIVFSVMAVIIFSSYMSTSLDRTLEDNAMNFETGPAQDICELSYLDYGRSTVKVPAIDSDGNGVVTLIMVEAMEGHGRTLVNIDHILFWTDTQYSIQVSKFVAQYYTGNDLSGVDLIYSIETDASAIEGSSAGAAMTIATIAALNNKSVEKDVMITGTINPDGSIGTVGNVLEKAIASKEIGATLFLVPSGQKTAEVLKEVPRCEKVGPLTYCTNKTMPIVVDVGEVAGIEVVEVANIKEAVPYFLRV